MTITHLSTLSDSDFLSLLRAYESGWDNAVVNYACRRLYNIQGFVIKPKTIDNGRHNNVYERRLPESERLLQA